MDNALTGGCACGQARYTIKPSIRFASYACHCTDCQSRTGSAFGLQLPVMAGDISLEGTTIEGARLQPSGARARIFACKDCLTQIYATNDQRPGMAMVRAGTLDDSKSLVPGFHLWISSKQPWVVIPDGAPALETQPADADEWRRLLLPGN